MNPEDQVFGLGPTLDDSIEYRKAARRRHLSGDGRPLVSGWVGGCPWILRKRDWHDFFRVKPAPGLLEIMFAM